jgi:hypothetical protein
VASCAALDHEQERLGVLDMEERDRFAAHRAEDSDAASSWRSDRHFEALAKPLGDVGGDRCESFVDPHADGHGVSDRVE